MILLNGIIQLFFVWFSSAINFLAFYVVCKILFNDIGWNNFSLDKLFILLYVVLVILIINYN